MARVTAPAPSVSVPATAPPAATTQTTASRGFAVVVPVKVSVLAGAFATVLLAGHVQTMVSGASLSSIRPLVQTAGLQVVPLMGLDVLLSSSGLVFSFAAVGILLLSLATLHPLFPAVLIKPDTWGTHSL